MADENRNDIRELIDLMSENNRATGEIERDGRNTRRHLLELKKMQQVALETSAGLNVVFNDFFESMDNSRLAEIEKNRESGLIFEEIKDLLADGITTKASPDSAEAKKSSGILSKLGGMMGPIAMGAGALLAGLGVGAAGLTYAMEQFGELDTEKIKENVDELLSIAESDRMTVANVASVSATMGALGLGLAAFSLGEVASKAVSKFEGNGDWIQNIRGNIDDLLAIADLENMTPKRVAGVSTTLGALGLGLAAFAVGKAGSGVADAVTKFTSGENFADNIKREVETLISIDTGTAGDVADFALTMGGLALGLVAFALGKAGSGVGDAVTKFSQGDNFAEDIKNEVETLLSIDLGKAGDTTAFLKTMSGLSLGLVAFAIGKGANSTADAIDKFTEGDFADTIKEQVNTLLSIGEDADYERTSRANNALLSLSAGLSTFAASKGLNAIADLGAGIVKFFVGGESPIEAAMKVGENAQLIEDGATAFDHFAESFAKLTKMDGLTLDLDDMVEDLAEYMKVLEVIMSGGTIYEGRDFKTKGLANLGDDAEAAVATIKKANEMLQLIQNPSTPSAAVQNSPSIQGDAVINLSAENIELRMPEKPAETSAPVTVASSDSSTKQNISIINQTPVNRVSQTVSF